MVIDTLLILAALHHGDHYRDFNPGLGVEVELMRDNDPGFTDASAFGPCEIYLGAADYRDSHANNAWVAGVGVRQVIGTEARLHSGFDVVFGAADNTEYRGAAVQPSVFLGYGRVNLHAALMAENALGFYLRYEVTIP